LPRTSHNFFLPSLIPSSLGVSQNSVLGRMGNQTSAHDGGGKSSSSGSGASSSGNSGGTSERPLAVDLRRRGLTFLASDVAPAELGRGGYLDSLDASENDLSWVPKIEGSKKSGGKKKKDAAQGGELVDPCEALVPLSARLQRLDLSGNPRFGFPPPEKSLSKAVARTRGFPLTRTLLHSMPALRELKLRRCGLAGLLGDEFALLGPSLVLLDVSQNSLAGLQEGCLKGMKALRLLNLSHNRLTSLIGVGETAAASDQNGFRDCSALEELLLDHNELALLPADGSPFWKHTARVKKLNCSDNFLAAIPRDLGRMKALEKLFADYNELVALPTAITSLSRLRELSVRGNRLTALPSGFATVVDSRLQVLDVAENAFPPNHAASRIGTDDLEQFASSLAEDEKAGLVSESESAQQQSSGDSSSSTRRKQRQLNAKRLSKSLKNLKSEESASGTAAVSSRVSMWEQGNFSLRKSVSGDSPLTVQSGSDGFLLVDPRFELFSVHGRSPASITLVPPLRASLSRGDCFVLDHGILACVMSPCVRTR
jgi:Leucine-rich repeat (LRR) protein